MKNLIIFNRPPYDNKDATWNGLRLADKLNDAGEEVRIFLRNDIGKTHDKEKSHYRERRRRARLPPVQ